MCMPQLMDACARGAGSARAPRDAVGRAPAREAASEVSIISKI